MSLSICLARRHHVVLLCCPQQRICSLENLHCRTDVLSKLAEMTDNDIRSCLNTLQFLKCVIAV